MKFVLTVNLDLVQESEERLSSMKDRSRRRWRRLAMIFAALSTMLLTGLGIPTAGPLPHTCLEVTPLRARASDSRPSTGEAGIRYARGFVMEYRDGCKKLQVLSPWRNAQTIFTYILVPRGRKAPAIPPGAMVVETPVRRMAAATTGCIPFLPLLHAEKTLVGLSGCKRVSTPAIAEMIRQEQIAEIGIGNGGMSRALNMEQLYLLQPEMVVVYGTGLPEFDLHPKLMEAGFKPVMFSSYMETTPLGRAEWIKFMAAFFDREEEADRLFDEIARRYEEQAARARNPAHRPTVFSASPYRGLMYIPGGGSYFAGFITDAGADYVWSDDATPGSMPLNIESLIERAKDADYWLEPGASRSLSELIAMDERFSLFKAFRTGQVYNNDARIGPNGGNDYWETGEVRPDLVLKDFISIFHPDLLPSHERIWYRQLPLNEEGGK